MRPAALELLEAAAEDGACEAARLVSRRKLPVTRTRLVSDGHRTRVLAAWLEDHGLYGVGEQGRRRRAQRAGVMEER